MIPVLRPYGITPKYNNLHKQKNNVSAANTAISVAFCGKPLQQDIFFKTLKQLHTRSDLLKIADFIGVGEEGSVYKIKNKDFCIKVPTQMLQFGTWTRHILPTHRANHAFAISCNGATAMKYIHGCPITKKPAEIYSLPNASYRNLLKQIDKATKTGLYFDNYSGNVIFDKETNSLTAIDFLTPSAIRIHETERLTTLFSDVFKAMANREKTPISHEQNRKLAGKLLSVLLEEIQCKKPAFKIDSLDISIMFDFFEATQTKLPKKYNKLVKTIKSIVKETTHPTNKTDLHALKEKVAIAKEIVNKEFLNQ